jgi:redox-sensitive bicupin YhaK (pirin superfamily)
MPNIESVEIVRAKNRHFSDFGWLKTYWLFSFASYYDPQNIQFGPLRVFNDDLVLPGTGFPTHPHEEMEIITLVLDGEMTHKDSMGNETVIRPGDVQRMSAGTGLTHSEYNLSEQPVHFYQVWILPDIARLEPSYDQRNFSPDQWYNTLLPVASGQGMEETVSFHTDATIYRSSLEAGSSLDVEQFPGRRVFIYLTEGELSFDGFRLFSSDQARIDSDRSFSIQAETDAEFILIDVPSCKGWGYSDNTLKGEKV